MKNISYLFATIFIITLLGTSCHNHDHDDEGHDHSDGGHNHGASAEVDHHEDKDEHQEKTVELNPAQIKHAEVDTGYLEWKNISNVVHANGYTRLAPQNQAVVSIPVNGTVRGIKVIEGDYVKKGQTIAQLFSLDYNNMLLEREKLKETIHVSNAQMEYLQLEYNRQQALAAENVSAKKKFEKVASDIKIERAKVNAVQRQVDILNQTIALVSDSDSPMITVSSPLSGYITGVNINIGSVVSAGEPMFSVIDNSKMHVDLLVYEKDLSKVKVGQKVRFVLINQSNKEITGEIYNIGKAFANDTKSVAVHADIHGKDNSLIPDMYINALVDVGNNKVEALPTDAIIMAEGKEYIFLWEPKDSHDGHDHDSGGDGHDHPEDEDLTVFRRLEVKKGSSQLGYSQVTLLGKINKGEQIVTQGAYYLQSHLLKSQGGGGHHH